jgi:hypothetical protein
MKKILLLIGAAGLLLGFAGAATAAEAPGAAKLGLVGPGAIVFCAPPQSPVDSDASQTLEGFAIFNYSSDSNTIKATVSVKGAQPNTSYPVRLIQNNSDCGTVDGVLTTNGQGTGSLNLREAAVSGSAQVIIDTGNLFTNPTYRATESYSWS